MTLKYADQENVQKGIVRIIVLGETDVARELIQTMWSLYHSHGCPVSNTEANRTHLFTVHRLYPPCFLPVRIVVKILKDLVHKVDVNL
jgi:hypothetical protein